ncbi:beige/BEACH domain protein [Rhynchospora pubera]|uniref:Beige/BEACH domain protein n=1 Tax=Rhynchospora pubera TaxID=906938 RepID=A0AAV8G1G5_9POAL|nr:beige/BEACH domain protein [Rhynchospora pubera]
MRTAVLVLSFPRLFVFFSHSLSSSFPPHTTSPPPLAGERMEAEETTPPPPCVECLEERILEDFSSDCDLAFIHGLSDSPLPFASSAVVQISADRKSENAGSDIISGQFIVAGLRIVDTSSKVQECSTSESSSENPFFVNTLSRLVPIPYVGRGSSLTLKEIFSNYLNESMEDNAIAALILLLEGQKAGFFGFDFLNQVGFNLFDSVASAGNTVRHPNICPILGFVGQANYHYVLQPRVSCTLGSIFHFSPLALQSDWHLRFLMYQIVSAIAHMHELGVSHGNVKPSTINLTDSLWACLSITDMRLVKQNAGFPEKPIQEKECLCKMSSSGFDLVGSSEWKSGFEKWWKRQMSNFDYLLLLNKLAGRRWSDPTFHIVMPWVIDFTEKPDESSESGWRDLTKSKWRLAKGDEQLDFTYSSSEVPHHVSDECLSELAVCSYKARRLPLSLLRSTVRQVYEPNEYPSTMVRLYQWTPDECIPEFYTDPWVFVSLHSEMSDLAVPPWAGSREEFIKLHREALESDIVSRNLHYWIDLTFGYKMSGEQAVEAKNVMLPHADVAKPRSTGRRQLFTKPHPKRNFANDPLNYLESLEEAILFSEHEQGLDAVYDYYKNFDCEISCQPVVELHAPLSGSILDFKFDTFMNCFEESEDGVPVGYPEMLNWKQKSCNSAVFSHNCSNDIFSVGCILAELYLHKPLFNRVSLEAYRECGVMPGLMQELPPHVALLVQSCIERDWKRRPSAKCLLDTKYFPQTIRSAYAFLAPLQINCRPNLRLKYASMLASKGALKAMGSLAAEACAPFCVQLILTPLPDAEADTVVSLLGELLKCLTSHSSRDLILPAIQKILQAAEYSHLKVLILQDSFVRDLWKKIGKKDYMEKVHPLIIANLCNSPSKQSALSAAVVLIGSCEDLGIPMTIHQTILPLIQYFGKGICDDGTDTLVRIGGIFGENFIVKYLLPLLRGAIVYCTDPSQLNKPEPQQSWNSLALIDCLSTLDGFTSVLSVKSLLKELIQDQTLLHVNLLTNIQLDLRVTQVSATALTRLCQRIGAEQTVVHILPRLMELFSELAFNSSAIGPSSPDKDLKLSELKLHKFKIESRRDLMLALYPFLASFIGIEKLRQCCSMWFLLEQSLLKFYNWKWDSYGDAYRSNKELTTTSKSGSVLNSSSDPARLLLNGTGWSKPQSQATRTIVPQAGPGPDQESKPVVAASDLPWFWYPSLAADDSSSCSFSFPFSSSSWKVKGLVLHSVRAHPGMVRSVASCSDECTVFTAGVGPGLRGSVQRWDLSTSSCVSGYDSHDEVVNSMCILSNSGRVASCDGTIHVWNANTGKLITAYSESGSVTGAGTSSTIRGISRVETEQPSVLTPNALTGGILSSSFTGGALYTCLHFLDTEDRIVAGMGNSSLRYIDIEREQKLQLWRSESVESSLSTLVSAICSCGPQASTSSYMAVGLSSGHCRLLDSRSGAIVASWRAHDGYITKLAALKDNMLVSSSLDKTLRVWDLRRNLGSQSCVIRGHTDGISSFTMWGQDVISISRNKISVASLSALSTNHQLVPQYLYSRKGVKNVSPLSTIAVLPFSRLFVVGTEDGFLKICS